MDMSALFGSISAGLSAAYGGPYHAGQVIIDGTPGHYGDDGNFVPGDPATPVDCMIQIDQATEAMRQSDGFADGDMRCLILASSFAGSLNTATKITVSAGPYAGSNWMVASIERDPFGAYWAGRGRRG